jgi:hypothetical protein
VWFNFETGFSKPQSVVGLNCRLQLERPGASVWDFDALMPQEFYRSSPQIIGYGCSRYCSIVCLILKKNVKGDMFVEMILNAAL